MDIVKLIILSLVCVVIGYILKSLMDMIMHTETPPAAPSPQEYPQTPPVAEQIEPVLVSDGDIAQPQAEVSPRGVFIRRAAAENLVEIELDGQRLASADALTEVQRTRLTEAANGLNIWLGRMAVPPPALAPVSAPAPETSADAQKTLPSSSASMLTASPSAAGLPVSGIDADPKPPRFNFNPINMLANAIKADMPKLPARSESLVMQVNAILQEKIQGTSLAQRGLALVEAPDHSMLVAIGLERYNGIDAVPDEEIRVLIRQCVAEWSSRMAK